MCFKDGDNTGKFSLSVNIKKIPDFRKRMNHNLLSVTVMVKVQVAVNPLVSLAVAVTIEVPTGKFPDASFPLSLIGTLPLLY